MTHLHIIQECYINISKNESKHSFHGRLIRFMHSFNLGEQNPFCIQTFLTVLTQQIPGHGDKNPNVSLPGDDAQQNITSLIHIKFQRYKRNYFEQVKI